NRQRRLSGASAEEEAISSDWAVKSEQRADAEGDRPFMAWPSLGPDDRPAEEGRTLPAECQGEANTPTRGAGKGHHLPLPRRRLVFVRWHFEIRNPCRR